MYVNNFKFIYLNFEIYFPYNKPCSMCADVKIVVKLI